MRALFYTVGVIVVGLILIGLLVKILKWLLILGVIAAIAWIVLGVMRGGRRMRR
jgi:hypothetical protein